MERDLQWKKDITLGGVGDLTKIWVELSRISYGVRRSRPYEQVQSYANQLLTEPAPETIQVAPSPAHDKQLKS
jgi:hypothetical protein